MTTNKPRPAAPKPHEVDMHVVHCPMFGAPRQIVKAKVGINTDFIFFTCRNSDHAGRKHMWAVNPSIRTQLEGSLVAVPEDGSEPPQQTKKAARKKRGRVSV